jgi:mRNA interferase YafQ
MRTIRYTNRFKRDYKREKKSPNYRSTLDADLSVITKLLATDASLLPSHRDHSLINNWKDHRDCHIKPDLILIYRKPDSETLELVRLGSHSQLGL